MFELDRKAAEAVRAFLRHSTPSQAAKYYGIPLQVVYACKRVEYDPGTLYARRIMRVEAARLQAEAQNQVFIPTDKDRYKGTRPI